MAILSILLALAEPKGMWEIIIKAFESFTTNYILAIILLTIIIRLVWAPIDLLNKRMNQKMMANQAKMQPELEKIKAKYGNNKQLLTQKQNEVYKKYNTSSVGSCLFMLVFMGLNLAIFLTLWTGLNNMSNYKIYQNYENLKEHYANTLVLTDSGDNMQKFEDAYKALEGGERLEFKLSEDGTQIGLYKISGESSELVYEGDYLTTAQICELDTIDEAVENDVKKENDVINGAISEFKEVTLKTIPSEIQGEEATTITLLDAVTDAAMPIVQVEYDKTQEKFLWIQNIWIADSPLQNSVFDYGNYASKVGKNGVGENEEAIYNAFMTPLKTTRGRVNGYFLLPILCVVATFLSMWLMSRKQKGAPAQSGGKVMKFVMPVIFGLFALFYSAVFAIYMFVSQIISTALTPVENVILKKWNDHSEKKKKEKTEAEYSRKF